MTYQVSSQPNPGLASLLPHMDKIVTAETEAVVNTFPILDFLTGDMSTFYRYSGSLTTPACNEIVQVRKILFVCPKNHFLNYIKHVFVH